MQSKPVIEEKQEQVEAVKDQSISIQDQDAKSYVLEKLIRHRTNETGFDYFVKWKGYANKFNSWVNEKDFDDIRIINDYWKLLKQKNKQQDAEAVEPVLRRSTRLKDSNKKGKGGKNVD